MTTELELERRMIAQGEERFWRGVGRTGEAHTTTCHGAGAVMLQRAVGVLVEEIGRWRTKARKHPGPLSSLLPYLDGLPTPVVAHTACRAVLDAIAERRSLASVAGRLGTKLQDEHRLRVLRKERPSDWQKCWKRLCRKSSTRMKTSGFLREARRKGVLADCWPVKDRIRLSTFLIEMVKTYTGLVEIVHIQERGPRPRTRAVLAPTPAALEWLESTNERLSGARPSFMPMVEPPLPWTTLDDGGYHTPELRSLTCAVSAPGDHLRMLDEALAEGGDVFLKAMNVAQAVPYRVNFDVLCAAKGAWNDGGHVAGLPARRPIDLPPYPPDDDMPARTAWRKLARKAHIERVEEGAKRLVVIRQLAVADELLTNALYYPAMSDFRGRMYTTSAALHPQGNDLARGLLQFDGPGNGDTELTQKGMEWMMIHLANCAGQDKLTFGDRLRWVFNNHAVFVREPTDLLHWVGLSDVSDPWQFLQAANAYRQHTLGNDEPALCLPVQIDGSNNGLQLFAMLARDPWTARATNCVPTDKPEDVYEVVAMRALEMLVTAKDTEALAAIEGVWGRKAVKRPVMTLPYGSTQHSCGRYVAEWFGEATEDRWKPGIMKVLNRISGYVWQAMTDTLPGALAVMDWMRGVAESFAKAGQPLFWVGPSGFYVRQAYPKRASGRVRTALNETVRYTRYKEDVTGTLDSRRQANGFPPNYVHSLDAGILHNTVIEADTAGIKRIRLIHDAFATTPNDMDALSRIVRGCFHDAFDGDPLHTLYTTLLAQAPAGVDVPEPPPRGDLDIDEVLGATYLFS